MQILMFLRIVYVLVVWALLGTGARAAESPATPPNSRPPKDYLDFAMRNDGNVNRGKELFFSETKASCFKCHSVDGSASKAGPDLFAAGEKFPRRDLIRSILEPSSAIAVGYGATVIETKAGDEYIGVVKQVTDAFIELMNAEGKLFRIMTADIKEQRGSNISLMPEGLQASMSLREFTDLIEYMTTLKQPENALTSNRGMPDTIPLLANPVAVRPFFGEELRFPHSFVHAPGDVRSGLVWFAQIPAFSNSFLVIHQTGKVWLLDKKAAADEKTLFGDFSSELFNERGPNGLLGLAFHPKFRENRKYYLKHQVFEEGKIATTLVEKQAAPDFRKDSGQPSRRLLKIVSTTQDHSGGCIQFGPDGYLYLGMGDTGPQQDPQGNGQDLKTHLAN